MSNSWRWFTSPAFWFCFSLRLRRKRRRPAPPPSTTPVPDRAPADARAKVPPPPTRAQKVVQQGIAIEFTVDPSAKDGTKVRAGEDANVEFKVTDTTTGTPVKGMNLSAWLSLREGEKAPDAAQCRAKIQSYLTGSMRARPEVDLNSYYILALNKSADI